MSTASVIFTCFLFSGAMLALLLATGQLLVRNRNRGNRLLFALYGVLGIQQLQIALYMLPEVREALPRLIYTGLITRYLFGPLLVVFFREILLEKTLVYRPLHFLPAALIGLALLPLFVLDIFLLFFPDFTCEICRAPALDFWANVASFGSNLSLLFYLTPLLHQLVRSRPDITSGRSLLRAIGFILTLGLLAAISNILFDLTRNFIFASNGSILVTFITFAVFILGYVYPEVLHIMRMEAYEQSRSTSPIKGLDMERLHGKLRRLMEIEKVYHDEDLQLKTVAGALEIRPNQLTYFLNHIYEKNFAAFINGYRVAEAKNLLVGEPDRTVLSIGYAVGFNSKTAFYRVFHNLTGQTPAAYRKSQSP